MAHPQNRPTKGFGADIPAPINKEAERIVQGMKRKSATRFFKLYGKRDREVMYNTANKLATKKQMECIYYKDFVEKYGYRENL